MYKGSISEELACSTCINFIKRDKSDHTRSTNTGNKAVNPCTNSHSILAASAHDPGLASHPSDFLYPVILNLFICWDI